MLLQLKIAKTAVNRFWDKKTKKRKKYCAQQLRQNRFKKSKFGLRKAKQEGLSFSAFCATYGDNMEWFSDPNE